MTLAYSGGDGSAENPYQLSSGGYRIDTAF